MSKKWGPSQGMGTPYIPFDVQYPNMINILKLKEDVWPARIDEDVHLRALGLRAIFLSLNLH